jgi:dTDP-D-glucose 4,6-dehydratase
VEQVIGRNFIHHILKKYNTIKIINYDKLTHAGNLQNLKDIEHDPNYVFIKGESKKLLLPVFMVHLDIYNRKASKLYPGTLHAGLYVCQFILGYQ